MASTVKNGTDRLRKGNQLRRNGSSRVTLPLVAESSNLNALHLNEKNIRGYKCMKFELKKKDKYRSKVINNFASGKRWIHPPTSPSI